MSTISTDRELVTLINVFEVDPEHQDELVRVLVEATEAVMSKLPGYISANIHRSLDGSRVANYAQWESREAFEAMLRRPEARQHMDVATRLATATPVLYDVVYCDEAPGAPGGAG
jgi:quinol monooxygenase YgiN